ncbi:MAG TPA: alpha/beta hydrolase [Rhodocyclaceae bacterium]|nr:MAG: alpha/beta hydrolase [Betaproteobacteria bacterium CG2_30_68_42]PIV71796.1 MAG: alpha/beta hydrolase [Rhodocyclales bacterium CG17_big_fil_post_rev_8_21_14_2_50_68_7]HCX34233.1 alpha/beta hydrolase [Rhodocyclaceae bacterium]
MEKNGEIPMRERSVRCMGPHGLHRMAYVEWGDARCPRVLICVHGLTRNGRDFDFLARALAAEYRVVCPDVIGRGRSEWLAAAEDYVLPVYAADIITLIARLDVEEVHWVGTSMGGLIGMLIAAQPGAPITRLVLNDVGPLITAQSLGRIAQYVGNAPRFASVDEAEGYVRMVSAPFGKLSDGQWRHLTVHALRALPDGGYRMAYDPAIAVPFREAMVRSGEDFDLWPLYDAIRVPTLLLRGEHSDLLTHATALEMTRRGPRAELAEIAGVGHAPMLLDEAQIAPVRRFLIGR